MRRIQRPLQGTPCVHLAPGHASPKLGQHLGESARPLIPSWPSTLRHGVETRQGRGPVPPPPDAGRTLVHDALGVGLAQQRRAFVDLANANDQTVLHAGEVMSGFGSLWCRHPCPLWQRSAPFPSLGLRPALHSELDLRRNRAPPQQLDLDLPM